MINIAFYKLKEGFSNIKFDVNEYDFKIFIKNINNQDYLLVKSSDLKKAKIPDLAERKFLILYQDLKFNDFLNIAEIFIEKYFLHYWFYRKEVFFLSILNKNEYLPHKIKSEEVHRNPLLAYIRILIENFLFLLENKRKDSYFSNTPESPIELEKKLDPKQLIAVKSLEGIVKVLAPAGSGKTKTLINRIINLINHGANPERILAVSFNKKAMLEMKQRLATFSINDVDVRTLHSLGYQIIRKKLDWRYSEKGNIKAQKQFITSIIKKFYKDELFLTSDKIIELINFISQAKLEILNLENKQIAFDDFELEADVFFKEFLSHQKSKKFLTFDDMVYFSLLFLFNDKELRDYYRNKYDFILVDEFQDLNLAQLLLVKILSQNIRNIFIVGDDDQLIYNWCGAKNEYIFNFGKHNSFCKEIVLDYNYRSTGNIVRYSKRLIEYNKNRITKEIKAARFNSLGDVKVVLADNLNYQIEIAIEWILTHKKNHNWNDFCFLYRYNIMEVLIALKLDEKEIPHTKVKFSRLFKNSVGYLVFSYLKLILYPEDLTQMDIDFVLRKPNKYLSRSLIKSINSWDDMLELIDSNELSHFTKRSLHNFCSDIILIKRKIGNKNIKASVLLNYFDEYFQLDKYYNHNITIADNASDNLIYQVIKSVSENYNIYEFYNEIEKALNDESDEEQLSEDTTEDKIILTSIHRTKGNEYNNVIYFNFVNEDYDESEIEDERRVAYVGITRAKENLLLTSEASNPSIFLLEAIRNPELMKLNSKKIAGLINKKQKEIEEIQKNKSSLIKNKFEIKLELEELIFELETRKFIKI